jgi:hypothetical protein
MSGNCCRDSTLIHKNEKTNHSCQKAQNSNLEKVKAVVLKNKTEKKLVEQVPRTYFQFDVF